MRKSELIELCDSVGYADYEGLKKTEIEVGLDEYLVANATTYSSDPKLAQFYKTKRGFESPMKKETSLVEQVETKAKAVKRRVSAVLRARASLNWFKSRLSLVEHAQLSSLPSSRPSRTRFQRNRHANCKIIQVTKAAEDFLPTT